MKKKTKPKSYSKATKVICDWTDKKNYLIHYWMLKLCMRHGMILDKTHEIISFKQSKCLEKYITFNTQKRNKAKNEFEKVFYNLVNNAFYGKTMENVGNCFRLEFFKKDDYKEIIKQQSKLTFNGIDRLNG